MDISKILVVIPARKGSKGILGKNKKRLNNKPLIAYTIEAALGVFPKEQICVSTDDQDIVDIAVGYGIVVPFLRPDHLSSDTAGSQEVLVHALNFYANQGQQYEYVCLLQATSPFRKAHHIIEAVNAFTIGSDMLVSVVESKANPYFNLMEEDENGWLIKSKPSTFKTRQEAPKVFEINGAIYLISAQSLCSTPIAQFKSVQKYIMSAEDSVDIDEQRDWDYAEFLLQQHRQ